ncbi:MAG TPA: methionine ABC transporter permease [Thermomicrobiales bacterium]|nr:methionine ABC transporter permease [Thermomicrobiales bacterium]
MMLTTELAELLWEGTVDTAYMVFWSTLIAVLVGLPLGVMLATMDRGGIFALPPVHAVLDMVINIGRSVPFIILMVAIIPFTRAITGTSIGTRAAIVPLAVASIPFFARVAETSLREVDAGLVEMMQATGGSALDIVRKVLVPEAIPSLVRGITITLINLIGYSAMAGVIGGGGLGDLAYRYGYQRFEGDVMLWTIIVLIVIVQGVQLIGNGIARFIERR